MSKNGLASGKQKFKKISSNEKKMIKLTDEGLLISNLFKSIDSPKPIDTI